MCLDDDGDGLILKKMPYVLDTWIEQKEKINGGCERDNVFNQL